MATRCGARTRAPSPACSSPSVESRRHGRRRTADGADCGALGEDELSGGPTQRGDSEKLERFIGRQGTVSESDRRKAAVFIVPLRGVLSSCFAAAEFPGRIPSNPRCSSSAQPVLGIRAKMWPVPTLPLNSSPARTARCCDRRRDTARVRELTDAERSMATAPGGPAGGIERRQR